MGISVSVNTNFQYLKGNLIKVLGRKKVSTDKCLVWDMPPLTHPQKTFRSTFHSKAEARIHQSSHQRLKPL